MELQNKLSIAETMLQTEKAVSIKGHDGATEQTLYTETMLQTEKAVSIKGHDGATEQTLYSRDHAPDGEGREY